MARNYVGGVASTALQERLATRLPPSRAERALEEIALGQALWKKFQEDDFCSFSMPIDSIEVARGHESNMDSAVFFWVGAAKTRSRPRPTRRARSFEGRMAWRSGRQGAEGGTRARRTTAQHMMHTHTHPLRDLVDPSHTVRHNKRCSMCWLEAFTVCQGSLWKTRLLSSLMQDGLDMSFHQLLNDASRMRTQLNEIGSSDSIWLAS